MLDPMFAAHVQQMRAHADRQRRRQVEPNPLSRRRLIVIGAGAVASAIVGLSAYRPAAPRTGMTTRHTPSI
ncbi:hypothetical protein [Pelagibacterium limicola]|uniref:hypothetical protein n=1 Tax=Pelagibacterium limicola TaxID=2791022 RepID=UPI0018AFAFFD|nr:hypothetical protein [Pelagibacterium limicola]